MSPAVAMRAGVVSAVALSLSWGLHDRALWTLWYLTGMIALQLTGVQPSWVSPSSWRFWICTTVFALLWPAAIAVAWVRKRLAAASHARAR